MDLAQAQLLESHVAEWYAAHDGIPGVEVYQDPDITWVVHHGSVWGNAGVLLRFAKATAGRRLDAIYARYQEHGRGMGFWVSPMATPENLPELLKDLDLRCRKRFPAMVRPLRPGQIPSNTPEGLEIAEIEDASEFLRTPHPTIGPITTPLRRFALDSQTRMTARRPQDTFAFVARLQGRPVGGALLFLGRELAGLHDLGVLEELRGRGFGQALVHHASRVAADHGSPAIGLLATGDGERVYLRCGFREVARFGYWFKSFQRDAG